MEEIMYNLSDLERFCDMFNIPFDEEEIKKNHAIREWNSMQFEDIIDDYIEEFSDAGWEATRSYLEMIRTFSYEIFGYEKEETKQKIHQMVKNIVNDILELQTPSINEAIHLDEDEKNYYGKTKEEFLADRQAQIKYWIFSGTWSCGKNFFDLYNYYYQASFEEIYSRITQIYNFEDECDIYTFDYCDSLKVNDDMFEGDYLRELDAYIMLLFLMACSKYKKDMDISNAYTIEGEIDNYTVRDYLSFYALAIIVEDIKTKVLSGNTKKKTR